MINTGKNLDLAILNLNIEVEKIITTL